MNKHVLITGGSNGIGRSMVYHFAQAGYTVWFTYRQGKQRAQEILDELADFDVQAFPFSQGDWDSHQALLEMLPGPVDILINNAALGSATVNAYVPERHLQDQALFQVNVVGTVWLTEALLPAMLQQGYGKVIIMSSVGGINQFPAFRLSDDMSKAALAFMGKQLAAEHCHSPVDVFTICPGATETAMFEASTLNQLSDEERVRFENKLPKKRLIQPEEIAKLALFLCRDEASVLHGAVLDASLGLGVHPGLITGPTTETLKPREPVLC